VDIADDQRLAAQRVGQLDPRGAAADAGVHEPILDDMFSGQRFGSVK
jgi:hypothetical protein